MEVAASQIGLMICFQRVRWDWTQDELASELSVDQIQISNVERGQASTLSDAKIDALFRKLDLRDAAGLADFIKWWNKHQKTL